MAQHRKALPIHSLDVEGQQIFFSLPASVKYTKEGEIAATKDLSEDNQGASTGPLSKQTKAAPSPYDDAVAALGNHFTPQTNIAAECHRFRKCIQQPGESNNKYVVALREHAAACLVTVLEDALHDSS